MKDYFILVSHAAFISGKTFGALTNNFVEVLIQNKKSFTLICHSINGNMPSEIYFYKEGVFERKEKLFVISKISVLRYITEVISTVLFFWKKNICSGVYIGIDPLNALSGVILKRFGKIKKVIFYTPDYSPKRFENKILNEIYHWIDRFCVRHADQVWNVSRRICNIRQQLGLEAEKNILLPNVPSNEYKKYLHNKKDVHTLVTLGIIKDQLDFMGIFDAIKKIKISYPDIILKIIGSGPKEDEYKKYVLENELQQNVIFLGYLDHSDALREISTSGIGLALYNGKWEFNHYGDSVKCREFFSFGLPVITTDSHSTVDEIQEFEAGIICEIASDAYVEALEKLFKNYDEYSSNAKKLGEKYQNIHANLINNITL